MSNERSDDADQLLEDIEMELASIRAAVALRSVDDPVAAASASKVHASVAPRLVGALDLMLTKSGPWAAEPPAPAAEPSPPATPAFAHPKRMSLQERLASLSDEG